MGDPPPWLDYAAAKPHARARKWARRILLAVLVLACLYATPIIWLYWGWRQEAPALEMVQRVGGAVTQTELAGPAFLSRLIPARIGYIRERVTDVYLTGPSPTDEDLRMLRRLGHLRLLGLLDTRITDGGLAHLKGLTSLQWLSLFGTQKITDAGLVHLQGLKGLQWLCLVGTKVTDAGLVHLQGIEGLQHLSLSERVTDGGLMHLTKLAGLQRLGIAGTKITNEGIQEFHKGMPNCRIED